MRCPRCDFENPEYAVVCEQCGEFSGCSGLHKLQWLAEEEMSLLRV